MHVESKSLTPFFADAKKSGWGKALSDGIESNSLFSDHSQQTREASKKNEFAGLYRVRRGNF